MRNLLLALAGVGLLVGMASQAAFAAGEVVDFKVKLTVTDQAGQARVDEAVTSGVPFAQGAVAKDATFTLTDPSGKPAPLQTRVLLNWPDGSIKWVLCDFQANVVSGKSADYTLAVGKADASAKQAVKVTDGADSVTIDTGAMQAKISKKTFSLFESVKVDGKEALNTSKQSGILIIDTDSKMHTSVKDLADGYKVEVVEAGPLRTVVRATGEMTATASQKIGFTCWYHFYAGSKAARVFFTLRVLDGTSCTPTDPRSVKDVGYMKNALNSKGNYALKDVSLVLAGQPADQFAFGGDPKPVAGKLDGSAKLYQDSSACWIWQAGDGNVVDPRLKTNIEQMKAKGVNKPYYEYDTATYDLERNKDSGYGYTFRGYKVYDKDGKETSAGDRSPGWAQLGDTTVAIRWFWQQCPKAIELNSDGTIRLGLWPAEYTPGHLFEGHVHKTHEILFAFGDKASEATAAKFERRLLAVAPNTYYCGCGAFNGPLMPEDRKDFGRFEDWALCAVQSGVNKDVNVAYSSCLQIEREKNDLYGVWHFGGSTKKENRGFGQYEELDIPYCLLAHYARTVNRAFFDEGEAEVRQLMDVGAHGGGYGHQAGESSHYYTTGETFYYYLTGLEFIKESIKVSHDQYAKPAPWHMRSFTMTMWSNLDMFRLFGEQQYLDKVAADLKWFASGQDPVTGFRDYGEKNFQEFMMGQGGDGLGRYCMEFPTDQEARDRLIAWYTSTMRTHEHGEAGISEKGKDAAWKQNNSDGNGYAYAYMLTGNEKYLDFGAKLVNESIRWNNEQKEKPATGLDPEWPRFRTGTASGKYWSEYGHRLTQTLMWAQWQRLTNGTPKRPAAVTDLAAKLDGGKITLTWAAPAVEGGKVEKYFVKVADKPIQDEVLTKEDGAKASNWWMTPLVKDEAPAPGKPGEKQTMTVTAPAGAKGSLYVAIRSARQVGWVTTVSELSNVVEVK